MQIPIKNKLDQNELFRIKRMKELIKSTNPHGHKEYLEIIYLQEGAGIHQIDHHRYEVNPFNLYLIAPGQIHSWDLTQIPKGYVMMLQKDFLLAHPLYKQLFQTFPASYAGNYDLAQIHQTVAGIFNSIETEYILRQSNYQIVILTYLQLLFNLLDRQSGQTLSTPYPATLSNFFSLLESQFKTNRDVSSYAGQLNITSKTLNISCQKYLNKTAGIIINEKITTESKKLLLYSDLNLTELAYELGFSDPSHFNKFFKRQTGVLPGIYRKGIS
ncbi:helix-turn-helix domain-containing protein [Dyadobacter frigoris]|uniref:Helix-turn-helix domain-containing protein n=1 Tax=Dyadobacter frigoris TaxID=2576211 RepID=A0A4U6CVJ1_9BACT|nr:helix-turn-helix domain-containing protein [Dyadobacter frigoris]TKT87621.1 helix-turn-helix domain-containing protein [Dyadobacter frigoris]GLU52682.1 AraC family transcriptional regulator [Dyadobacter frigoris]